MKFITGKNRQQVEFYTHCLDDTISQDNEVRLIDLFIDSLNLSDYGFEMDFIENGCPAYHPSDLLKLFIYGYLNRMRSSRILEKECTRNIELIWLMKGLVPDHNTIANFRKDNPKAIRKVFQATVALAKHFELIGGKLLAGDSNKLRAQNSKKNNFNPKKIERHLEYIDNKLAEYDAALALADGDENKKKIQAHIDTQKERKDFYNIFENKQRMDANKELYRKRQAIVEHPFGIIKRQWGFYYIMTKKGINRAAADVGLIFTAYNLRRLFNLIDKDVLKAYLKEFATLFSRFLVLINQFLAYLTHFVFSKLLSVWLKQIFGISLLLLLFFTIFEVLNGGF